MTTKSKSLYDPQTLEEAQVIIDGLTAQLQAAYRHREKSLSLMAIAEAERRLSSQSRRALYILNTLGIDPDAHIPDSALHEMGRRIKGVW